MWHTIIFFVLFVLLAMPVFSTQDTHNNPLCQQQFTLILATGRSGSTTTLEMLNQLPGYGLTGEHDGILNTMFTLYEQFKFSRNRSGNAWKSGIASEADFLNWIQSWFILDGLYKKNENTTMGNSLDDERRNKIVYGFKVRTIIMLYCLTCLYIDNYFLRARKLGNSIFLYCCSRLYRKESFSMC
jgi:hypothetical protein